MEVDVQYPDGLPHDGYPSAAAQQWVGQNSSPIFHLLQTKVQIVKILGQIVVPFSDR